MDATSRIERSLANALATGEGGGCPPRLLAALRAAVFPGGARIRPRLCLAVAMACGDDVPELTDAAAAALEILHCASLVHDDLPCFDDAATRRGLPTLHRAFNEGLAVLAGDALIVLAFQVLGDAAARAPQRLGPLLRTVGGSVGLPAGIVCGQAWECEPRVSLTEYHRAKTGALFVGATVAGAQAAGASSESWRPLGERLGEAYQVADDIRDAIADEVEIGKPVGRDAALARPSAVRDFGVDGAVDRFRALVDAAIDAVPDCRGADALRALVLAESRRLLPKQFRLRAA